MSRKQKKTPENSRFYLRGEDNTKRCPKHGQLDRNLSFPKPRTNSQMTAGNAAGFLYSLSPQRLPRSLRGMITGWGCLSKATTRAGMGWFKGLMFKAGTPLARPGCSMPHLTRPWKIHIRSKSLVLSLGHQHNALVFDRLENPFILHFNRNLTFRSQKLEISCNSTYQSVNNTTYKPQGTNMKSCTLLYASLFTALPLPLLDDHIVLNWDHKED